MAKRRKAAATKTVVVRSAPRAPAPIRISVPRAAPVKHKRRRAKGGGGGHRSGLGGTTGAMSPQRSGALALGGFLYGYLEKNVPQIPVIPVIGKSGTIAVACYFLGGKSAGIVADVGNAASVIAGYSFGATGKISGAHIASQVSGIAAQI
jgi:hypothetical protein